MTAIKKTIKDISNITVLVAIFVFTFMLIGLELFAYRRSIEGAANKEILQEIKDKFGEEMELFQIKELINAGKNKKVG
jgi:hypothetical protein